MGVSKVVYGNNTIMDISGDTVTADKLLSGETAHGADGEPIRGTLNIASLLLEFCYPVGTIYTSTNNVSPATFLGGTWTRVKDRFLLTAGDTYVAGTTGGSANAIVPYHTHTQNSHNHSQNSHNHGGATPSGGSHEHFVGAPAGHSWGAYFGNTGAATFGFSPSVVNGNGAYQGVTLYAHGGNTGGRNANHAHGINADTATNNAETATNQYAGTNGNTTGANMPPYKVVYAWERTA